MNNIVVGIDFTEVTEAALDQGLALALEHQSQLTLVHGSGVSESGMLVYSDAVQNGEAWTQYVSQRLDDAERGLKRAAEHCRGVGARVKTRLCPGPPDEAVLRTSEDVMADLIVVGTHARKGAERWLQGSVAERIVRGSDRASVLVAMPLTPALGRWQRVLVGTDFSESAHKGLRLALSLSATDAHVELLHAFRPAPMYGLAPPPELDVHARDRVQDHGNQLLAEHGGSGRTLRFTVADGDPLSVLLSRLDGGEFDVLVVGSHGRRGLRRMILGSVAENVIREANRSVLVVHGD